MQPPCGIGKAERPTNLYCRSTGLPIPGSPPDMTKPPKGCPFASRCQFARNICAAECPPFVQVGSRQARCWLLQPDAPAEGNPLHEKLAEAERKAH